MDFRLQTIYVKPYVKAYFDKVGFDKEITKLLGLYLQSKNERFEHKSKIPTPSLVAWRPKISEEYFTRYGNKLTYTNGVDFAVYLERYIVKEFESAILAELEFCQLNDHPFRLQAVILKIRDERLNLSEDDLPLETIRKRIQRFCEAKSLDYKSLKKRGGNVPKKIKKAAKTAKIPRGYMLLEKWLELADISERTWRNNYRHEFPTVFVNNKLAVATVEV